MPRQLNVNARVFGHYGLTNHRPGHCVRSTGLMGLCRSGRIRPPSAPQAVLMATARNVAPLWILLGPHQFTDHRVFRQPTGIEAHQIALEFLKVPLQQSGRSLPEHSEHARRREDD